MKVSKQIGVALIAAFVVLGAYQHGKLDAYSATTAPKIGVVNVTKVLENSQRHKAWQEKMKAEQTETLRQFEQMNQELEAAKANLKLRTPGTEDFLKLQQEAAETDALLNARRDSYGLRMESQMQTWTEGLYQELIKVAEEVAKSKGLDIILSVEEPEVPAPSLRDFMLTIKTKKMIYHNEKYDLTEEVRAALDKKE